MCGFNLVSCENFDVFYSLKKNGKYRVRFTLRNNRGENIDVQTIEDVPDSDIIRFISKHAKQLRKSGCTNLTI